MACHCEATAPQLTLQAEVIMLLLRGLMAAFRDLEFRRECPHLGREAAEENCPLSAHLRWMIDQKQSDRKTPFNARLAAIAVLAQLQTSAKRPRMSP